MEQRRRNYYKSCLASEDGKEWLYENPVDNINKTSQDILTNLNGSGDSVFVILRPLLQVQSSNSECDTEVQNVRNHKSHSVIFEDDSEYNTEDRNISSSEILSTFTSTSSLLNGIITQVGITDKNISPMEQLQEGETAPEGEVPPEGEAPPEDEPPPEDDLPLESEPVPESEVPVESDVPPESEPPTSESEPTHDAEPESQEPSHEEMLDESEEKPLTDITSPEETAAPTGTETSEDELTALPQVEGSRQSVNRISTISNIPIRDSAVLAQLKEADEQACKTAMLIQAMRQSISLYNQKEELTDEDARKLELKQNELMKKLAEFEDITRRVQRLVGLADTSSHLLPKVTEEKGSGVTPQSLGVMTEKRGTDVPGQDLEEISEYLSPEDKLPKVVICGTQDQVPRIIVCEGLKRKRTSSPEAQERSVSKCKKDCPTLMMSLMGRLNESYYMQEKLATENADLEGFRYSLQEELLCKDNAVDCLQRKVGSLQAEMRIIVKENSMLSEKLTHLTTNYTSCPGSCGRQQQQNVQSNYGYSPQGIPLGMGPGDMGSRIQQYTNDTCQMECQLHQIENEVKQMQNELGQVQRERQQLEQQRKIIKGSAALGPNAGVGMNREATCNAQLRELREQYNRLQDDYKSKVTEVAALRSDSDRLRQQAELAREAQEAAETRANSIEGRVKNMETESKKFLGSKEQIMDQELQLNVAKQRFREAQDELEEMRGFVEDQATQLEDYRNKFLQAQEQVEEQRRQIDLLELDNSRISEQVNIEIQRVKNQFQEKLQELTPLPDLLKATQMKLQEAQQIRLLAERNLEQKAQELQEVKEQAAQLTRRMDESRSGMQLGADEKSNMMSRLQDWEKKCNELKDENIKLKTSMARVEEVAAQNQKSLDEKLHEVAQLAGQLETVREESARQVARTKDRSETMRRSLQCQISDLEKQLAQSRATARSAQKERNEIRQRMQSQINNLNDNFDQAQLRIQNLQSHVNYLKASYTDIIGADNTNLMITDINPSTFGLDTCDCNF